MSTSRLVEEVGELRHPALQGGGGRQRFYSHGVGFLGPKELSTTLPIGDGTLRLDPYSAQRVSPAVTQDVTTHAKIMADNPSWDKREDHYHHLQVGLSPLGRKG